MRTAQGFTYLGVLFALAIIGLALATAGTAWSVQQRREREQMLLWTGAQFRQALQRYYLAAPLGIHQFPVELGELLEDRRGPETQRHLRRLYPDPMTGAPDWQLVRSVEGRIVGVASRSNGSPLKRAGFAPEDATFSDAACYCDWQFSHVPPALRRS